MAEESKVGEDEIEEEDRISNLPDGVLIHILSFLPTKSAVTTSHLSRRWRNLWQHLSVLDFSDDSHEYVHDHSERFRNFALLVNGVLTLLRNPRGIRKMTLECAHSLMDDKFRAYSIETWVRAVIGPHLQELDLDIDLISADNIPAFNLPQNFFFTCTNLVSLSLSSAIHIQLQSSTPVTLPSLKKLLIDILYVEVPSLNALLCGCPNIEILDLCFSAQSLDKICIPTSLKWLKIAIENDVGAYLEMNTPDLEYLHISGVKFGKVFSMYNLHKVVEAYLDVFPQSFSSVIPLHDLFSALSGTKHLVLSYSTTKWLLGEPHDLLFQEFRYLLHLELILPSVNSNSILSLLQKCPMLQALLIQNDEEQSPILGWAPQSSTVPNCLGSHLTFIQIKGFQGFPDEVSFVEHVLQKGLVLRTMIIGDISLDLDINKKYDILKRLSNVPRASGMCQLTFD